MKQTAVRARIRQLCCLGLPGELLVASLLPALRELVPSDSAGYFWVDGRGEMANLYAERLLPPAVMSEYFERFYDGREGNFRRAFSERAAAPDGVVATSADAQLQRTEYYNEILRRLDAHHVLYGVVREQGRPVGQVSLYRPADGPAFSPRERADLASVLRYVAHGMAVGVAASRPAEAEPAFVDTEDEAMLVTESSGNLRHASGKARRLLLLATTSEINARTIGAAVNERAANALRQVCERLVRSGEADGPPPTLSFASKWGRYVMRAFWLDDSRAPGTLVGVRIQRQEPTILRFVHSMGRLPLSPQQREIALLLARGASNHEIADNLGVSVNTVAYHIKQLFQKLDVHDRAGAVSRIVSGAGGLRP